MAIIKEYKGIYLAMQKRAFFTGEEIYLDGDNKDMELFGG